jgi:hypothetical protein
VFTCVVRQRCQSGLLLLSNQRASARLGSLWLTSALLGTAWRNTAVYLRTNREKKLFQISEQTNKVINLTELRK